jgi:hypothetical protein
MIAQMEALDVTRYAAQYELLRAQVTGTPRDMALGRAARQPGGIGLALLMHEGMPGWLKAVEAVLRASSASPAPQMSGGVLLAALERRATDAPIPHVQHHDITILLASLVLSTRHPAGLFTE